MVVAETQVEAQVEGDEELGGETRDAGEDEVGKVVLDRVGISPISIPLAAPTPLDSPYGGPPSSSSFPPFLPPSLSLSFSLSLSSPARGPSPRRTA